ncbi:unnamed protein product [Triticum turgidum subsp. durum]|uniref:Uncharacterized protein n=1 Tax=Triticum turgidum subsp. durum TaxID=4567 RepID=A0A9R1P6C1_TRITD|nr:unnamed protein product [Triticum turgidum subsp. durum]
MGNPDGARKKKRRKRSGGEAAASFDRDVFPILLAAVAPATGPNQRASSAATAARLLRRLLPRSPPLSPLPGPLVALLPLLLTSSSHSVAALSCEVMGAAALQSMEAGEALASDGGIASGLARALGSGSQRVAEAACNAVMDLSASSIGREHLSGSPVLPRLLWNLFLGLSVAGAPGAKQGFQSQVNV